MKVEHFPMKNQYISKRNMELFEDRVQPYQALGWLRALCKMQTTAADRVQNADRICTVFSSDT